MSKLLTYRYKLEISERQVPLTKVMSFVHSTSKLTPIVRLTLIVTKNCFYVKLFAYRIFRKERCSAVSIELNSVIKKYYGYRVSFERYAVISNCKLHEVYVIIQ